MITSAFALGISGLLLSFLPQEISMWLDLNTNPLILQHLGASYLGFGMLNWTAKANLIGGIYGRPVSAGNFVHFTIGAITLLKYLAINASLILFCFGAVYSIFAMLFAYIFFNHPKLKDSNK